MHIPAHIICIILMRSRFGAGRCSTRWPTPTPSRLLGSWSAPVPLQRKPAQRGPSQQRETGFWNLVLHTALQGEWELAMFGRFRTRPCRQAGCYCRYFASCFFQSTQRHVRSKPWGKDLFKKTLIKKQKKRKKKRESRGVKELGGKREKKKRFILFYFLC